MNFPNFFCETPIKGALPSPERKSGEGLFGVLKPRICFFRLGAWRSEKPRKKNIHKTRQQAVYLLGSFGSIAENPGNEASLILSMMPPASLPCIVLTAYFQNLKIRVEFKRYVKRAVVSYL